MWWSLSSTVMKNTCKIFNYILTTNFYLHSHQNISLCLIYLWWLKAEWIYSYMADCFFECFKYCRRRSAKLLNNVFNGYTIIKYQVIRKQIIFLHLICTYTWLSDSSVVLCTCLHYILIESNLTLISSFSCTCMLL